MHGKILCKFFNIAYHLVSAWQVGYHPDFENSRCLFIVRKDGETVDFSYWKCIKGLIRKNYPLYADSFILRHFRKRRRNDWMYHSETRSYPEFHAKEILLLLPSTLCGVSIKYFWRLWYKFIFIGRLLQSTHSRIALPITLSKNLHCRIQFTLVIKRNSS